MLLTYGAANENRDLAACLCAQRFSNGHDPTGVRHMKSRRRKIACVLLDTFPPCVRNGSKKTTTFRM